jgi:hypothetical protein
VLKLDFKFFQSLNLDWFAAFHQILALLMKKSRFCVVMIQLPFKTLQPTEASHVMFFYFFTQLTTLK